MKKKLMIIGLIAFGITTYADLQSDVYDFCATCNSTYREDIYGIREYGFSNWYTNHPEFKAIVNTISNDYTRALSSLSHFETNKLERTVFLKWFLMQESMRGRMFGMGCYQSQKQTK